MLFSGILRPADAYEAVDWDVIFLLAGAETLQNASYYTLVIEASFVAIERTVEFRLLERGSMQPDDLPGTHPSVRGGCGRRFRRIDGG